MEKGQLGRHRYTTHGAVAKCTARAGSSPEGDTATFIWCTQRRPCEATSFQLQPPEARLYEKSHVSYGFQLLLFLAG